MAQRVEFLYHVRTVCACHEESGSRLAHSGADESGEVSRWTVCGFVPWRTIDGMRQTSRALSDDKRRAVARARTHAASRCYIVLFFKAIRDGAVHDWKSLTSFQIEHVSSAWFDGLQKQKEAAPRRLGRFRIGWRRCPAILGRGPRLPASLRSGGFHAGAVVASLATNCGRPSHGTAYSFEHRLSLPPPGSLRGAGCPEVRLWSVSPDSADEL